MLWEIFDDNYPIFTVSVLNESFNISILNVSTNEYYENNNTRFPPNQLIDY
jgi:hypothetical protein